MDDGTDANAIDLGIDLGSVTPTETGAEGSGDETSVADAGADVATGDSTLPETATDAGLTDSPAADADVAECKSSVAFHPTEAGLYCPYTTSGADGGSGYCAAGSEHCCESPSTDAGASLCAATGTACVSTWTDWGCSQPSDCPSGQICCINNKPPAGMDTGCSYYYLHSFTGTVCATSCDTPSSTTGTATQLQLCQGGATDCPTGQTCQHVAAKGADFGFCQ
jgi:hypothetical protein